MIDRSEVIAERPKFRPGENIEKANYAIAAGTTGRVFAVIAVTNSQFKVTGGDLIVTKRLDCKPGDKIVLHKVLLAGTKDFTLIGTPLLSSKVVEVTATIIENHLAARKIDFRFKKTKRYARKTSHRDQLSVLRIHDIALRPKIDK